MPSWFFRLWDVIQDPDYREALSWLGGGIVAVVGGIWAGVKFFAERKKSDEKKGGDTNVTVEQGNASGRDTNIGGDVIYGADGRQLGQAMAEAQRPLLDWVKQLSAENAELVRRLEQGRVGPQAPGSQQAVAEAVDATAKDAAAGNPRAKKALELLNAGKIAEAVPLFQAEAAEKEATSRVSAKEAAAAYRNLGAIAGLRDPKRALEAYEKAVELDPDDVESLFWAGYIQINYGDLNKALARAERLLTLAQTGNHVVYKYRALVDLGSIKQHRGDLEGALKSYSDGLAIIEPLAKSDPVNAQWRYDRGIINERIGDVQMAQGDLAAALKSYEARQDIVSRLAKSDPGNANLQRDLSVSNERLGDIFLAQGNLPAALEQYRASLDRMVPIHDRDPSNADLQRFTSVTLTKIGDVQMTQGDLTGALKSYQDGHAIMDRLAKSDPRPRGLAERSRVEHWQARVGASAIRRQCKGARLFAARPGDHGAPDEALPRQCRVGKTPRLVRGQIAELAER